jgi:hypothetical protein
VGGNAESIAAALDSVWQGETSFDTAMVEHQRQRDERVLPIYEFTSEPATMQPPPRQMLQLLAQIQGNQAAMDAFVSINAATVSPADFFNPAYLGQLLAA